MLKFAYESVGEFAFEIFFSSFEKVQDFVKIVYFSILTGNLLRISSKVKSQDQFDQNCSKPIFSCSVNQRFFKSKVQDFPKNSFNLNPLHVW